MLLISGKKVVNWKQCEATQNSIETWIAFENNIKLHQFIHCTCEFLMILLFFVSLMLTWIKFLSERTMRFKMQKLAEWMSVKLNRNDEREKNQYWFSLSFTIQFYNLRLQWNNKIAIDNQERCCDCSSQQIYPIIVNCHAKFIEI